ncbi:CaiB/BaiF CoA transferase family protein [Desulfoscipio gibsoniae]|uniref:Putative acyl-CoA transferase/carnitine dehydratase n=1 Tax=Desulfoscipio gibsoniae DSM 7213 TaxID=767817 RepID=R4KI52_9FIRM|nr:CaiB/BaiF CoA-transferase family protein [Desulfoscipio gibsoniae]AGL00200.1 putative acyl-CoA transferase/carnitine dehydratase [Desulfoscipio gibsoniae DSM 7213]
MESKTSPLADVRVLELAGEVGSCAGKMFADLGADVIHIEPPQGDPARRYQPFYKDVPSTEGSLEYQYFNTNKRGMVLDITTEEGKEIFLKLVKTADILIENERPGYLDQLGLGYSQLSAVNPKLVHVAITPFGQDGPYKDFPQSDLVCMAMGGFLYLAGKDDEKPSRAYGDQAYMMGSLYAAMGSIIALYHAEATGEGQFLDVSMQESVSTALENAVQYYDLEGIIRRSLIGAEAGYGTYPCRDGYIFVMAAMGKNRYLWDPFVDWLIEDKIEGAEVLRGDEWLDPLYRRKEESVETFKKIVEPFLMNKDKLFLYEESQRRKCCVFPVSSPKDVYNNPQLQYRKFFKTMYHEALGGEIHYPGPAYDMTEMKWELSKPAPVFGQHTSEILQELGYTPDQIAVLVKGGVVVVKEDAA